MTAVTAASREHTCLTTPVPDAARMLGLSERSLRRYLDPGGDLDHLAIRAGRRVLVVTARLEAFLAGSV